MKALLLAQDEVVEGLRDQLNTRAIEIDNSAAERALRGVAIGRSNYLFASTDSGGERAAAVYTLIGTAKLNGVAPDAWLRHVLAHIADHPVKPVDDFLPWRCAAQITFSLSAGRRPRLGCALC